MRGAKGNLGWRLPAVAVAAGAMLALLAILLALRSKQLLKDATKADCVAHARSLAGAVHVELSARLQLVVDGYARPPEVATVWQIGADGAVVQSDPRDADPPPAALLQTARSFRGDAPYPMRAPDPGSGWRAATWIPAGYLKRSSDGLEGILVLWDLERLEQDLIRPRVEAESGRYVAALLRDPDPSALSFELREVVLLHPPLSFWKVGVGIKDRKEIRRNLRWQTGLLGVLAGWLLVVLTGSVALFARRQREDDRRVRAREQFLTRAYHELQTPLALMRAAAETVKRGAVERPQDLDRCVDIMTREEERLTQTIRRLLRYLRLESGQELTGERAPVRREVERIAEEEQEALKASGLTLEMRTAGVDEDLLAPRDLVEDTMRELLANVRKHAREATTVRVTLEQARTNRVVLRVEDDGAGLSGADGDSIFEPWTKGTPREGATLPVGSGLGLALIREGLAAIGGSIAYQPAANGGASFVVEVPCQRT